MVAERVYSALLARVREQNETWAARTEHGNTLTTRASASSQEVYIGSLPSRLLAQQALSRLQRRARTNEEEEESSGDTVDDERERRRWRRKYAASIRYAAAREKLRSRARASALAAERSSRYEYLYDVVLLAAAASRELPRPPVTPGVKLGRH